MPLHTLPKVGLFMGNKKPAQGGLVHGVDGVNSLFTSLFISLFTNAHKARFHAGLRGLRAIQALFTATLAVEHVLALFARLTFLALRHVQCSQIRQRHATCHQGW